MASPRRFLIIDDNSDGRALLTKTLMRKFPKAILHECQDADSAIEFVRRNKVEAIIVHRVWDVDGPTLIRSLRAADADVPIVAVSGMDRSKAAIAAGASRFMDYDEWLRIGTIVEELIGSKRETATPFPRQPVHN